MIHFILAEGSSNDTVVMIFATLFAFAIMFFVFKSLSDAGRFIALFLLTTVLLLCGLFIPLSQQFELIEGELVGHVSVGSLLFKSWLGLSGLFGFIYGIVSFSRHKPQSNSSRQPMKFQ